MATVNQKLVIEADPKQPVAEISNIITAFIQLWPGSEEMILKGVKTEIDTAIKEFESAKNMNLSADSGKPIQQNGPMNRQQRRQRRK